MMRLIDDHRVPGNFGDVLCPLLDRDPRTGYDHAVVDLKGIAIDPLRSPQEPDRVAVDNRERLVEFRLELELPLPQQARGSDHQAASGAATPAQFLEDHPGLDRLAKADLIAQ